jgi:molybdate transport system substrate-binding protein
MMLAAPSGAAINAQGASPLPTPTRVPGELTVYAAASLRDAFKEIGANFEAANPGFKVVFSFAGSQQLAEQIGAGAPADVFASANKAMMDAVIKTGRVGGGTDKVFARNRLVVIVPGDNPARIRTLKDLAKRGVKLVLADKRVPVGGYSLDFLAKAARKPTYGATYSQTVLSNVVSYEEDVKAVFSKVALGEADAGIVYSSDVVADKAKAVRKIDIPNDLNTVATYPVAPLQDSPNRLMAQRFIDYVLSPEGQKVLVKYGFIPVTKLK